MWTEGKDLQESIYTGSRTDKRLFTGVYDVQEASHTEDRIYKRPVTRGRGKSQIEREVGQDVIERAKVFQIWLSGVWAHFVIQSLVRDFGTASYIYIYISE